MEVTELLGLALRLVPSIVEAIIAAAKAGDVKTVEALRSVVKDPTALAELDWLLIATQRAKAAATLRPTAETVRRAISADVTARLPLPRRPTEPGGDR